MSNIASRVWFITGCSTGFGRELAKRTIANGWPTVVTARNKNAVADLVDGKDNAFAVDLDVTKPAQIGAVAKSAEDLKSLTFSLRNVGCALRKPAKIVLSMADFV